jgi:hypothetical protein
MASTHERAALGVRFARRTRYLRQHLRLVLSVLLGIFANLALPASIGAGTRLLAAFDFAAVAFLGTVWIIRACAVNAPGSHLGSWRRTASRDRDAVASGSAVNAPRSALSSATSACAAGRDAAGKAPIPGAAGNNVVVCHDPPS